MPDNAFVTGLECLQSVAAFAASGAVLSRVALDIPDLAGESRRIRAAACLSAFAGLGIVIVLILTMPGGGHRAVLGVLFGAPAVAGLMLQSAASVSLAVDPGRKRVASLMAVILAIGFGLTDAVPEPHALATILAGLHFIMTAGAVGAFALFLFHADDPDLVDYLVHFLYVAVPSACGLAVAEALVFVGLTGLEPSAAGGYMQWVYAKLGMAAAIIGVAVWCFGYLIPRLRKVPPGQGRYRPELIVLLVVLIAAAWVSRRALP